MLRHEGIANGVRLRRGRCLTRLLRYRSIVDADPDDVRIWLKIADLYAKKGATEQAIDDGVGMLDTGS